MNKEYKLLIQKKQGIEKKIDVFKNKKTKEGYMFIEFMEGEKNRAYYLECLSCEEKITEDEEYKFYECYSCGEKGKVLY